MVHWITCLIPTCKNTCGRNNTKTTFLEIFVIGYHGQIIVSDQHHVCYLNVAFFMYLCVLNTNMLLLSSANKYFLRYKLSKFVLFCVVMRINTRCKQAG